MTRKAKRAARRRKAVDRTERVKPSAMAEAKKQPWLMAVLLQRGPDNNGTSAEQHEAAIEIVGGFDALTRAVSMRAASPDRAIIGTDGVHLDLDGHGLRLASIYLRWATELLKRFRLRGPVVVEWVNMERPLAREHVPLLVRALDLWGTVRDEWRPPRLTTASEQRLTASPALQMRLAPSQRHHGHHANTTTDAPRAMAEVGRAA
jgi:hypothetical protein